MILVDSCVLLDVMTENTEWYNWSSQKLESLSEPLAINPIIYAEVSVKVESKEDLDEALISFKRLPLTDDIAFLAAKAFLKYRKRGGEKRSPLPDFFIGSQAAILKIPLLTRDIKRYKTYFPSVRLIHP
jgi:predicted nucleic acid-binding protein